MHRENLEVKVSTALIYSAGVLISRYATRTKHRLEQPRPEVDSFLCRINLDQSAAEDPERAGRALAHLLASELGIDRGEVDQVVSAFKQKLGVLDLFASLALGVGSQNQLKVAHDFESAVRASIGGNVLPLLSPLYRLKAAFDERTQLLTKDPDKIPDYVRESLYYRLFDEEVPRAISLGRLDGELGVRVSRFVERLSRERVWLPARPIPPDVSDVADSLKLMTLEEALARSSYGEVISDLLKLLTEALSFYKALTRYRGLADTLDGIFSVTTPLVPAPSLGRVLVDLPFYPTMGLYAAATAEDSWLLVGIDVNGIQDFVYSPVSEAAASRVLRGRSLLIELVQFTALKLIERMTGANRCCLISREGGNPVLLVPGKSKDGLKRAIQILHKLLAELFSCRLWVTVSHVECSSKDLGSHDRAFECCFRALGEQAGYEKASRFTPAYSEILKLGSRRVVGLDSLTREVVFEDDDFKLEVSGDKLGYADELAPGKLQEGDLLSGLTHLSIACGNVSRNLSAIVSIYFFRGNEPSPHDAERFFSSVVQPKWRIFSSVRLDNMTLDVAWIPMPQAGAVHVLVSLRAPEPPKGEESIAVAEAMLKFLSGCLSRYEDVDIEVRVVNAPHHFIPSSEVAECFRGLNVSFSFNPFFYNPYHPVSERGLLDLGEMGVIALAKADGDKTGTIVSALAMSAAALASLSNFLVLGYGLKAYSLLLSKVREGRLPRVVLLYSGGDDTALYGKWDEVTTYLNELREKVLEHLLDPLSISVGLSIAEGRTPVLHLYSASLAALEEAKEERWAASIRGLTLKPLRLTGDISLDTVAGLLECVDRERGLFMKLKGLIYTLAEIASLAVAHPKDPLSRARVVIWYKYLFARRRGDVEELNRLLSDRLPKLEANSDQIIETLAELKPVLDLLALKVRLEM